MKAFSAKLIRPEGTGTWTYLTVPFPAEETFGSKGQIRVKGTVNGATFRSSLMPHGDGRHYLVVNQALRAASGVTEGDSVDVTMELDTEERGLEVPEDFLAKLGESARAQAFFDDLAYSYRKEYVTWIDSAKKAETRANRIVKSIGLLEAGKKLK
ncbi:YdeI/OmpD-associated family protein [Cohnella endophytica]|uniref:YdeI/OmpD-associated family protein n=1 Tax=Cohnella endophytica TaxID=2419778 RepID=UPI0011C3E31E|nr:YdeI/OmpD-associated family protein [Cohnella endophytica]